jgi:hypothetical protein
MQTLPAASPTPSPSLDPIQQACQADQGLLTGFVDRYANASADLNASKRKNANFLTFVSRLNDLIADMRGSSVSKGYALDRAQLLDGVTKVKDGTFKALNATSTKAYKAGTKMVDDGHDLVTQVGDRLAADYFSCTVSA